MIIRDADISDAQMLKALHDRSALTLCKDDYTPEQLDYWVNHSTVEKYQKRLEIHRTFVAEIAGVIVGFVRWNPATNELCSLFVDPDHTRQGIATKLMQRAYKDVRSAGVTKLWLYASLTAVPFYKADGWEYIEQAQRGPLACVRMEKTFTADSE